MSGIVGLYYLDGRPAGREDLERMVDTLAHRGPDGAAVWCEDSAGLGHRMLHTTPESLHEKLPLVSADRDLAITSDARIDNRGDLFSALGIDRPQEEVCDSELILKAYEKWGEQCPERLLGDFAFAIWDKRNKKFFCARDQIGVKPFYYYRSPRLFAFASEIKALLCLPEVPRRLNEARVAEYLVKTFEDKAVTFYESILRLPPANTMSVGPGHASTRTYWALDPWHEIKMGSDDEYAEAFRDIFTEAVRCRLRSAFPVGSMLSGGLDSSSIVCVARDLLSQINGQRLHTFSLIFDDVPESDERPYINAVLAKGGLEPHLVRGDQKSPLADLDKVLWHHDEPFPAPNLIPFNELNKAAQQHNVRVVLYGEGGDQAIGFGFGYFSELTRACRLITLARELIPLFGNDKRLAWFLLRGYIILPLLPEPALRALRALRRRSHKALLPGALVNPAFAERIGLSEPTRSWRRTESGRFRTERELHLEDLDYGKEPLGLEILDKTCAAFNQSPRYPFYDRRLLEFCLALPSDQNIRHGYTRTVLRRAMTGMLPDKVRYRVTKGDSNPNSTYCLLKYEPGLAGELLDSDIKVIEDYVDVTALRELCQRYSDSGTDQDAHTMLLMTILARGLGNMKLME